MRHRTQITVIALLLLITGFVGSAPRPACAEPPPGGPPPGMRGLRMGGGDGPFGDGPGMMVPLMLRHANLTADQQQRVREILEGDRERLHRLFSELDAANDALASKVVAPGTVDPAALKPEIERVARLRQDLMEQGLRTALAVRAVLTPEQLDKAARTQSRLRELQEEMRQLLESGAKGNEP